MGSSPIATSVCIHCRRNLSLYADNPGMWVESEEPNAPDTEHCYSYIDTQDNLRLKERKHYARADLPIGKTPEALERWLQS